MTETTNPEKTMLTPTEARQLTSSALSEGSEMTALLEIVSEKVRVRTAEGHSHLAHPVSHTDVQLAGFPSSAPCTTVQEAARKLLEAMGYEWKHHRVEPSNDPQEFDWDELCW